jgi:predicted TIM-barrel fold metal-dependent hydrolase
MTVVPASPSTKSFGPAQIPIREKWLAQRVETVLEPDLPILDAHHHLWDRPGQRYLFDEFLADTNTGHRVVGSIFIQCRSMYRADGPDAMKPVGETEFVNGIAARSASGMYGELRACAGIVGFADLTLGAAVKPVLEAHLRAAPDRFKGVRNMTASDPSPAISAGFGKVRGGMLMEKSFREGFSELAPLGLSADVWAYHPQLPEVIDLARSFPETSIIVNHCGGPLNQGHFRENRTQELGRWRESLETLSEMKNVTIKLGGMCMQIGGLDFHQRETPPSSEELAEAFRPLVLPCIKLFGAERCMFESNFAMDKGMASYAILWNAFKRLVADHSPVEKSALFAGTAARVYRLQLNCIAPTHEQLDATV